MKFGTLWWPNSWLKMSTQVLPHDGVAAVAVAAVPSTPAVPTPPTRASVAAVASTLLLMDIKRSSRGTSTAVPCARLSELIRAGTADLTGHGPGGEAPVETRKPADQASSKRVLSFSYTRRAMLARGLPEFVWRDQIETLTAILTNVTDVPDARE